MQKTFSFLLLALLAVSQFATAQAISGKVSGSVRDAATGETVPYATVVLFQKTPQAALAKDSTLEAWKQVNGALTDEDGSFKLKDIKPGNYRLDVSFVGYDKTSRSFETSGAKPDADLGEITLEVSSVMLDAVTVSEQKQVIEQHVDKLVFNAENDPSLMGGDATEVLRKTPLLTVDNDGNVSLQGNSNVRLLINGKPSTMFSGNVGEALRSIPAEEIKKVEVITVPTAKYDGEGSGGIVNIITKKKGVEGFKGSISGNLGTRRTGGNGNITLGAGRFGLNGSFYGGSSFPNKNDNESERRSPEQVLEQLNQGTSTWQYLGTTWGAFYDFNAYNSLNTSINYRGHGFNSLSDGTTKLYDPATPDLVDLTLRDTDLDNSRSTFDWTTDFRRTFEDSEREYSAAFQLSGNNSNQDRSFTQTGQDYVSSLNTNQGINREYTYQLDAVEPISKWGKLEIGSKAVIRRLTSDFEVQQAYSEEEPRQRVDAQSDEFDYEQDVISGYASLSSKLSEKFNLNTGLRYEYTRINFDFQESKLNESNEYNNFLPSAILSYKLSQMSSARLSYARRIQRPSLYYLNPYVEQSASFYVSQGNPALSPEITDQYELGYNTMIKGSMINATFFMKNTEDVIESYQTLANDTSYSNYLNLGSRINYGTSLFSKVRLTKWASMNIGANLNYYEFESKSLNRTNEGWAFSTHGGFDINFLESWKLNTMTFYNSGGPTLQGTNPSMLFLSFGLQKEIIKDKATITLSANNPFRKYQEFERETNGPNFYQHSISRWQQRDIRIGFRYSFGDLKFRQRTRRTKIENDDMKSGGGGQGEGGN